MRKSKLDPSFHIGDGENIKKSLIIGFLNAESIKSATFKAENYSKATLNHRKKTRAIILCEGDFVIEAWTNSRTLYHRYENLRNTFSEKVEK